MGAYRFLVKTLTTFFGIGYLPLVPGTFGSAAGLALFYLVKNNTTVHILITCALVSLGFLFAGQAEKIMNKKDARCIVIDEVSGMLLALLFIPYDIKLVIIAFFLFRIFDSLKPYPVGLLEGLKGSLGIMSDDIVAGLYTNFILQVVFRLVSFRAS